MRPSGRSRVDVAEGEEDIGLCCGGPSGALAVSGTIGEPMVYGSSIRGGRSTEGPRESESVDGFTTPTTTLVVDCLLRCPWRLSGLSGACAWGVAEGGIMGLFSLSTCARGCRFVA